MGNGKISVMKRFEIFTGPVSAVKQVQVLIVETDRKMGVLADNVYKKG